MELRNSVINQSDFGYKQYIGIPRRIEPNSLKVLDFYMDDINDYGFPSNLQIISIRGDEFNIDRVDCQED